MDLTPNTWYPFGTLFDGPTLQLQDGSSIRFSSSQFAGSTLQALTGVVMPNHHRDPVGEPGGCLNYLQLTLLDIDRHDLGGLPHSLALTARLFREQMLYVPDCSYAYDVHIRNDEETYYSKGAVCVCMSLKGVDRPDRMLREKNREVQTAFQRGLLDEAGKSSAAFRLHIKPMLRKLAALRDSGHLPDNEWQVDVVFAHWYAERTDELEFSPFQSQGENSISSDNLEIQFKPQTLQRDLRVADLFSH
jgi:hypothetical protein